MKSIKAKRSRSFSPKSAALAIFLGVGYLSAFFCCFGFIPPAPYFFILVLPYFMMLTVTVIGLYLHLRSHGAQRAIVAAEALVFVVLVAWGLGLNFRADTRCIEADCGDLNVYRPLAFPGLLYLSALHAFSVIGYVISRRRPTLLPPKVELLVISLMLLGCILQISLAVHFGKWVLNGLVFAPLTLPAASPVFALVLFAMQIRARLRQAIHALPTLAGATGLSVLWLCLYAVVAAIVARRNDAALDLFTKTCDYTFSQLPVVHVPCTGHYLCTVAARGHRGLVRPIRWGMRGGRAIIVNRQLAVANAFEDLLTERFPRLGRFARRNYDRLGLPISRFITNPLLADLVYLAMKPAEWCFYTFLLLADSECPEQRISRMYAIPTA